jgi:uncharacterized protein YjfI (DUF2170 family)
LNVVISTDNTKEMQKTDPSYGDLDIFISNASRRLILSSMSNTPPIGSQMTSTLMLLNWR